MLPESSPRSRRGRRLRKLLRLYDEHYAALWADREPSGVGPLVDEQKRIENELEGTSKEACRLGGHSVGHIALPAAPLLAMKLAPITTARPPQRSSRRSWTSPSRGRGGGEPTGTSCVASCGVIIRSSSTWAASAALFAARL
jgi:hypothetical protein